MPQWAAILLVAAAYFLAGRVGLMLAFDYQSISPIWPPTGIALAVGLLLGRRYGAGVFLGAFLVNFVTTGVAWTSLLIAVGNTLEYVVACTLTFRFANGRHFMARMESVIGFTLSLCAGAAVAASVGTAVLVYSGQEAAVSAGTMWLTWWLGDISGGLTLAPLILLFFYSWEDLRPAKALEFLILLLCQAFLGMLLFSPAIVRAPDEFPLAFITLLPVLWAAARYGMREVILTTLLLDTMAVFGTLNGTGQFAVEDVNSALTLLQTFVATSSIIGLALAAAMAERRESERSLETRVQLRTRELESARKQDQANLQRLRSTILNLPMGAVIMDDGRILMLNDEYCRMFGVASDAKEAMTLSLEELTLRARPVVKNHQVVRKRALDAMERSEELLNEHLELADGRVIQRDLLPITDGGFSHGFLMLYRDVTRERRADLAKSEFMSLASHQLRTPLTAIRWSLSRLIKGFSGSEADRRVLEEGLLATKRMSETINTMLKISRVEAEGAKPDVARVTLLDLFHRKQSAFREQYLHKRQEFGIDCPPDLTVDTDVAFLQEILRNLLQNAIQYTPEGGRIILRARRAGDRVVIEVEDSGYGIPVHQQDHVFRKFYRGDNIVHRDTEGTGLGLYLVDLLAKALGAEISMRSEEGKGTSFALSFPVRPAERMVGKEAA